MDTVGKIVDFPTGGASYRQAVPVVETDKFSYWLAYYSDFSEFAVFATEIHALRFAVENDMQVAELGYGDLVREALRVTH